jgi:hypothetical protein
MKPGLNETTSIGRVGAYRPWVDHANTIQLATCVARDLDFQAVHRQRIVHLGGPVLPLSHSRQHLGSGWTGRGYAYTWEGGGFDVHLTNTLPGALFIPHARDFHFRFSIDNGVPRIRSLQSGATALASWTKTDLGRLVLLENWGVPTLLASSSEIFSLTWVSHEHLTVTFADERANLLFVPLLKTEDVPSEPAAIEAWLRLAEKPPVRCQEFFETSRKKVKILQQFFAPDGKPTSLAPLPPLAQLSPISSQPAHRRLLHGLIGPYSVAVGDRVEYEIDIRWAHARIEPTREVSAGGLAPIPTELAYAGDVTWEPGTPMDQLLSLRIWAPLAEVIPAPVWDQLRPQLTPPTADAFRASLAVFTEPVGGRTWAKEAKLFELAGDISYDSDWYNGFELSGLERAVHCADPAIAEPAKILAQEIRPERDLLTRFFEIYHDWELGAAWSDGRGAGWNTDCSHNGLEGLLSEARLRESEGDREGADFIYYLAAKTGSALIAAEWLADYLLDVGFFRAFDASPCGFWILPEGAPPIPPGAPIPPGEPTFGIESIYLARGGAIQSPSSKNPYALAPHFPEFNALQRAHGRMERYREVAEIWKTRHPNRYADWIKFYCGVSDPSLDTSAIHSQEARVQAAVMYHLAPDVCFRLWTLGEDAPTVEDLFQTPLNLAEQILCRAGMKLSQP